MARSGSYFPIVLFVVGIVWLRWALSKALYGRNGLIVLKSSDKEVLARNLPYYANLERRDKRRFEKRVTDFVNDKEFHGRGVEVTREMQVMIAGASAQLTFGLEPLLLMHFTRILVYPDRYRNRTQQEDHIGEVNPGMKIIAVSWKHFLEGFALPTNAYNVGLHEMAHALWFENRIPNVENDFLDPKALEQWRALAQEEATRIDEGKSGLFRRYAATNQAEFFAVAVEYFFEQPALYREKLPELYECMVQLLRQDPMLIGQPPQPVV